MFCSLNFTCMLLGAIRSLSLSWMLQFKMLQVAWTILECAIQDAAGFVVWSWLELHIQVLYFYNIFICKFWTWIVFHIHFQSSNIYILTIFALWDTLGFNFYFFSFSWNLMLESVVGIGIWFLNLLLSLNFKFKRFWNFYLKWVKRR